VTSTGAPISGGSAGVLAGSVTGAPGNLQNALTAAGFGSVSDIATLPTKDLTSALTKLGVTLSATQVTQLQVSAKTVAGITPAAG
jgi:hypothetical protein